MNVKTAVIMVVPISDSWGVPMYEKRGVERPTSASGKTRKKREEGRADRRWIPWRRSIMTISVVN